MQNARLKLSVMFRTALLWAILQIAVVISYHVSGQPLGSIFRGQASKR